MIARLFLLIGVATGLVSAPANAAKHGPYPVAPGQAFRDKPWSPPMMVIPGGTYLMGSPDAETVREGRKPEYAAWEHPQTEVTVPTLAIGEYHVTRGDYARFIAATHRPMPTACNIVQNGKWVLVPGKDYRDMGFAQGDDEPVGCVSWEDAEAYTQWLSSATGHRYRLIHEAEWEYAARGGTKTARWWGDGTEDICAHVNGADREFDTVLPGDAQVNHACDDGYPHTNPVDHFPPNPFGLHDMIGNLWQWTDDCFSPTLPIDTRTASGPADCPKRAIRGGSWHNALSSLRAANRFYLPHDMVSASLGFRVIRLPDGAGA